MCYPKTSNAEPTNSQPRQSSKSVNATSQYPRIAESIENSGTDSGNLQLIETAEILKNVSTSDVKAKSNIGKNSEFTQLLHVSKKEAANYKSPQDVSVTEIKSSYGTEPLNIPTEESILIDVYEQTQKLKTVNPTISLSKKKHVLQKGRPDIGERIKEVLVVSYRCKKCKVPITGTIGDHIHGTQHQTNMGEEGITEVGVSANTECISERTLFTYACEFCSVTVPSVSKIKNHIRSWTHMFNIAYVKRGTSSKYYCTLCSVSLSSIDILKDHIKGKSHENKEIFLRKQFEKFA